MIAKFMFNLKWSDLKQGQIYNDEKSAYSIIESNNNVLYSTLLFRDMDTQKIYVAKKILFGLFKKVDEMVETKEDLTNNKGEALE